MTVKTRDPLFILYVRDMDRALRFYRDTFDLDVVQHTPGWSMLRFRGSTIALHITGSSDAICRNAGINFQVDDLDAAIEAVLAAGGEHVVTREPDDFVPVRMCELKDTEGNAIELRQFVGPPPDLSAIGP